jgi:cytochrome c oxidase subunit 2
VAVGCSALASGCANNGQNALHAKSPQAHDIGVLWWWMLAVASVVFLGACAMLVLGWRRRGPKGLPFVGESEQVNQRLVVTFGIALPIVVLVTLFLVSNVGVIRATAAPKPGTTRLTVQVIGHQWWWEIRYPGTPVVTADVIHSFWVPELNRKIDQIPGRANRELLYADHPGVYRGQCAEYCSLQHAHMSFYVVAQTPAAYAAWLRAQSAPAGAPPPGLAARGRVLFLATTCSSCHAIRGTSARAAIGPDLTHVASRSTLAALTIANTPADLLHWISDPQHVKPGAKMPKLALSSSQFRAIAAYLRSLR